MTVSTPTQASPDGAEAPSETTPLPAADEGSKKGGRPRFFVASLAGLKMHPLPALRAGIALAGAIAALVVWVAMAPASVESSLIAERHDSLVSAALADQTINAASASSAPQQTVVNTWTTVDLLEVISIQLDDMSRLDAKIANGTPPVDERPGALILVALLVGTLTLAIQPVFARRTPQTNTTMPRTGEPEQPTE